MPLHNGASAMPRQYLRKPSAKIGGFDQSTRSVLRSGIFCSGHKSVAQPQARFGKPPNRESFGSLFPPFRRFAVSPFRSYFATTRGQVCEARAQVFPDFAFDLICIARAIDHDNALGLMRREVAIPFADTLIKFGRLLFHSIRFAWLTLHSRLSSSSIHIEHESDVRYAIAGDEGIQALDHLGIQFACRSLINGRGIEEAIGNHAHATFERRLDYLAHELAATSLK